MNPINGMVTYLATGKQSGPYVSSTTSPNYVPGELTGTGALTSITSPLFVPSVQASSNHITEFYANGQFLYSFQPQQTLGSNYGGLIAPQVPTTPLTASQAMVRSEFMTNSGALPGPGVGTPSFNGGYASWTEPGVVDPSIYNAQDGPNIDGTDWTMSRARTYHIDLQQNILPNLGSGCRLLSAGVPRHGSRPGQPAQHGQRPQRRHECVPAERGAQCLRGIDLHRGLPG